MTCSPARLAANRANALKSTGPRSARGKARSARNATLHGLLATTITLSAAERSRLVRLRRHWLKGLDPLIPVEAALFHQMTRAWIVLERVDRLENVARRAGDPAYADVPAADHYRHALARFHDLETRYLELRAARL